MYVKSDKVERFLEVTNQKYLDKNIHKFVDIGYVEGLQLLLEDIAKKSGYTEGERIMNSDLLRIKNAVAMIHNQMRVNMVNEQKDLKGKALLQYDPFTAMVNVNDYLYAMTMKTLGCPDIPESFGIGMQNLIKDIAHKAEFELKESDYKKTSIDNYYEKQRRQNAVKVRKDTRENEKAILNNEASSLRVAKYAGEYYALKKRQEGHGKVWRFFHKKENEQRTKLLSIMEKTLKTILKDDDKLEDLDPQKIAEIYNKQQLTGRLNETVQSGIAKRNEVPTNFFAHTPTTTARAEKEIDNPNQEDIELESELRMPLVFDDEFKKESEAVTMTYVKKVDDKIVTQTVVHDDGHIEVDLSDKSPVAKF